MPSPFVVSFAGLVLPASSEGTEFVRVHLECQIASKTLGFFLEVAFLSGEHGFDSIVPIEFDYTFAGLRLPDDCRVVR